MKHERATEELKELAALYALDSLTQHEARSFEVHLKDGCPVCEAEFRKFQRAAVTLGFSVTEAAAPEYVRDLLSARIEREPRASTAPAAGNEARQETPRAAARPVSRSVLQQPEKEGTPLLVWTLMAALALAAAVAIFAWKAQKDRTIQLANEASSANSKLEDLKIVLDSRMKKVSDFEELLQTVSQPGTRIAHLKGQPASPVSLGAVVWDPQKKECMVIGSFPPPPEGKTYQLWFLNSTVRMPAGVITANPAGGTFARVAVPQESAGAPAAMLTIEPESGSQTPTLPYYAVGRLD